MRKKLDLVLLTVTVLTVLGVISYFWYVIWDGCKCNPKNIAQLKARRYLGAIIRQQQSEHYHQGQFTDPESFKKEHKHLFRDRYYWEFDFVEVNQLNMVAIAKGKDNAPYKTQDFIGGLMFNVERNTYETIICKTEKPFTPISYPFHTITFTGTDIKCGRNLLEARSAY